MLKDVSITISDNDESIRIDKLLARIAPDSTRALINQALLDKQITLNGKAPKKSDIVSCGDVIHIATLFEQSDRTVIPQSELPLNIVYQDNNLIACDKPGGMSCHPNAIGEQNTLANALVAKFPCLNNVTESDTLMCGMLHRIDIGTSGLVVVAKDNNTYRNIRQQFSDKKVKKIYHATVIGEVKDAGGISLPLAHSSSFRGRMRCVNSYKLPNGEKAMFAETFYKPLAFDGKNTTLEVTIYTGVTHQIRCHLAHIGHPIIGDTTYGAKSELTNEFGKYHLLKSVSMSLIHPSTKKPITIHL